MIFAKKGENTIWFVLFFFSLWGCGNKIDDVKVNKIEIKKGGYVFEIVQGDSILASVTFSSSNELIGFYNPTPNFDQLLTFHYKTGVLIQKENYDLKTMKVNGQAYHFYSPSGNLSDDFNYVNGIKSGWSTSFFDSVRQIESHKWYNSQGKLCYRRSFDKEGNIIKTEGSID
jgi:antitoxin component YwqK of YwqJK toxin-antitoxin module